MPDVPGPTPPQAERVGVWLIGARGSVATTAVVGAAAMAAGLAETTGLVTGGSAFAGAGLPRLADLVFGGSEVVETPLAKRAEALAAGGVIPPWLPTAVADSVEAADAAVRPGIGAGPPERPLEAIRRIRRDLEDFRTSHRLARVVVINLSSTEAPAGASPAHGTLALLNAALERGEAVLPPSSLYAYAALDAGCGFVDFTPSLGARIPALEELALQRGVPHAGSDGKTGETLVKSVLAPMFADRALRVRSWAGTNILGGGDGAALADPARARSKLDSKGRSLEAILGYPVDAPVHIDYVADQGEWKTAWDHIGFEGFLGTRMRMQFTWEGCDSALAAPLVLDLARLTARAAATGRAGAQPDLAFFFKDPAGSDDHRLDHQYARLCAWAEGLGGEDGGSAPLD